MFLLAIVMFPLSAAAMQPLDETDLSLITGRSGVSFFVDVTMDIHIDTLAWGDSDGLARARTIHGTSRHPAVTWGDQLHHERPVREALLRGPILHIHRVPNSVSFWPQASTIDVHNGIPYYRVHAGPGRH